MGHLLQQQKEHVFASNLCLYQPFNHFWFSLLRFWDISTRIDMWGTCFRWYYHWKMALNFPRVALSLSLFETTSKKTVHSEVRADNEGHSERRNTEILDQLCVFYTVLWKWEMFSMLLFLCLPLMTDTVAALNTVHTVTWMVCKAWPVPLGCGYIKPRHRSKSTSWWGTDKWRGYVE